MRSCQQERREPPEGSYLLSLKTNAAVARWNNVATGVVVFIEGNVCLS
jgi:hypothetical protein